MLILRPEESFDCLNSAQAEASCYGPACGRPAMAAWPYIHGRYIVLRWLVGTGRAGAGRGPSQAARPAYGWRAGVQRGRRRPAQPQPAHSCWPAAHRHIQAGRPAGQAGRLADCYISICRPAGVARRAGPRASCAAVFDSREIPISAFGLIFF